MVLTFILIDDKINKMVISLKEKRMAKKFNEDSKIRDILADERGVAIFERLKPGVTKHPMLSMAKGFSMKRAEGYKSVIMSYMGVTEEQLKNALAEIMALEE